MVVQEVLVGIDIGLISLLAFTYLRWRRLKAMREIEEAVLRSITEDMQGKEVSELTWLSSRIRAKLHKELSKRYAPLEDVLRIGVKVMTIFLIIYNLFLIIFY